MKKIGFVVFLALLTLTSCYNKSNTLSQTNDNLYSSNKGNASNKNYNNDSIKKAPSSLKENTYSYTNIFFDTAGFRELVSHFNINEDKFDPQGWTWYVPKSAPKSSSEDAIYLYFGVKGRTNGPLRLRVQYHSDDWLFIEKAQFYIKGKAYEFIPRNVQRDNDYEIWEWFDNALTIADKELIYALSEAKTAEIKFIGSQYYDIRYINQTELSDIKNTLLLYNSFGGDF